MGRAACWVGLCFSMAVTSFSPFHLGLSAPLSDILPFISSLRRATSVLSASLQKGVFLLFPFPSFFFPSLQLSFEAAFAGFSAAKDVPMALTPVWEMEMGKTPLEPVL